MGDKRELDGEMGKPFRLEDGPAGGHDKDLAATEGEIGSTTSDLTEDTPALDAQDAAMEELPEDPAEAETGADADAALQGEEEE